MPGRSAQPGFRPVRAVLFTEEPACARKACPGCASPLITGDEVTEQAEVRLRVAARAASQEQAVAVGWETEAWYTNWPAGGGGARSSVTRPLSVRSCLLPRALVQPAVQIAEVP